MKAFTKRILVVFSVVFAATWISGCVVHAHSGDTSGKPAKAHHGKPAGKAKPANRANPAHDSDAQEADHNPPPPPVTY
ncbi:MAG: hypothetical protein GY847_10810 [Proteobacteria bacterium]|nr:hypothetical protein [Pseudomonadota bacterium]